jgi:hypothetical protein
MGQGWRTLALSPALAAGPPAADHAGEIALGIAMTVALVCIAATLLPLARVNGRDHPTGRARLTPALVIVTGGAAVTFVSYLAYVLRCHGQGCRDPGWAFGIVRTWWRRDTAWEWGAQLALASVGLVAGSIALAFSARGREDRARPPLLAARVAYFAWALIVFLPAATYEVFVK